MKTIKVILAAALVMFALPAAAQEAQGGPGGMGGGQGRMNALLFKDITLTEVQKTKVDSIQAAGREAMRAQMQAGGMQAGGMQDSTARAKMMETRAKQMAEIRALLTAEQQVVFDKNLAAMPPMGAGGRRPPPR